MSPKTGIKGLLGIFDKVPTRIPRDLLALEGINWLATKSFGQFAKSYPEHATWLRKQSKEKGALSLIVFSTIGALIGSTFFRKSSTTAHAFLAYFLTSTRRAIENDDRREFSESGISQLQRALLKLEPDIMTTIVEWLASLESQDREYVDEFIASLDDPEEVTAWFGLTPELRLQIAKLHHREEPEPEELPDETEEKPSALLEGLRNLEASLREKREKGRENNG